MHIRAFAGKQRNRETSFNTPFKYHGTECYNATFSTCEQGLKYLEAILLQSWQNVDIMLENGKYRLAEAIYLYQRYFPVPHTDLYNSIFSFFHIFHKNSCAMIRI